MQRIVLTALALGVSATVSQAQPLSFDSTRYSPHDSRAMAPVQGQAAPRYAARRRPDLGGGFIEMLFGGLDHSQGRRQTVAPPPPMADPGPIERIYAPTRMAARPPAHRPMPTMDPTYLPTVVAYEGTEKPGTIIVNTEERFLYLVMEDGTAKRYGIGVGRPGFTWAGVHKVTAKREWPDWRPPKAMLKRQPELPRFMPGGPDNPLGARALYLGSTLYRIHGSNEPWTIGRAVSSGCIRMRNRDVKDLYQRVGVGTKVVVI